MDIIKRIEEKGYKAYIVGDAVIRHLLGKPIEEYDVITSAPLFSLSKKQVKIEGGIAILEFSKPLYIHFSIDIENYYKTCVYRMETICYHYQHGFIDQMVALKDIEKKELKILNLPNLETNPIFILSGLDYVLSLDFHCEKRLENYFTKANISFETCDKQLLKKYLSRFLLSEQPGKFFLKYKNIFSSFFFINERQMKFLDFTRNNLVLRLVALWMHHDILEAEKFLKQVKWEISLERRILHLLENINYPLSKATAHAFIENFKEEDIPLIFALKRAELLVEERIQDVPSLENLENYIFSLYSKNLNLTLKDLKINEDDLKDLGFKSSQISFVLQKLLKWIQEEKTMNTKEHLIALAYKVIQEDNKI